MNMQKKQKNNTPLSQSQIDKISNLYSNEIGTKRIAEILSLHPSTVQKHLKRLGVLKRKQKYKCNENFFSSYTPQSVYWAGFIIADGYVREGSNLLGIHLKQTDREHLQKFLSTIESNHPIYDDVHVGAVCIQIHNGKIKQDLFENFQVIPRKSKIAQYPSTGLS